ncbi:hypothetical protein G9F32_09650 [Acinetobacter sp. 194]|uniref:hypothetical protein n=1 Tax=Acinetobacter shaoyimingii TaxID=2715164 RepID=UPI00140DCF77|nr:hypothetical protein [Acinetobacter shaoyimingii]NHB58282.1 hypothetical protein [Acinetobacter shaoyimingii]
MFELAPYIGLNQSTRFFKVLGKQRGEEILNKAGHDKSVIEKGNMKNNKIDIFFDKEINFNQIYEIFSNFGSLIFFVWNKILLISCPMKFINLLWKMNLYLLFTFYLVKGGQ